MTRAQRATVHACDEHIGVQDFLDGLAWYRSLLQELPPSAGPARPHDEGAR